MMHVQLSARTDRVDFVHQLICRRFSLLVISGIFVGKGHSLICVMLLTCDLQALEQLTEFVTWLDSYTDFYI